jgi:hypothetical protein
VLLGTGSGSFVRAADVTAGKGPRSVVVGDFNRDCHKDLAVANNDDGTVSVLVGTRTGRFGPAHTFTVGAGPRSIAIVDSTRTAGRT